MCTERFLSLVLTVACSLSLGAPAVLASSSGSPADEAAGIEMVISDHAAQPAGRPDSDVLLIPDSSTDRVAMFDPMDGTYLGDLITENPGFSTPVNAIPGPDGNIYVSEQLNDAVFVFDDQGTYLYTYADATDGLNNIRGIAFRGNELFITSGDDYIARFDGPHNRLPDFIADDSDPYDLLFLEDGSLLVADIQGSDDNIRYYDAAGVLQYELFDVNFPEQLQRDPLAPGEYLNASFSADQVTDFDLDGTIHQTWFFNAGRGIYRLGNGNLLLTAGDGVWEMDPATGELLEQEYVGSARFIELLPGQSASVEPNATNPRLVLRAERTITDGRLSLQFGLESASHVQLDLLSVDGRRIMRLHEGVLEAGSHEGSWALEFGRAATSGVYFVRLRADGGQRTQRVVLTR